MAKNNKKTKVAIIIFLITAIIATALTAVLAFGDSNEGYRTITVIEIGGTVGVVHGNMEYAAYTGMHLEEGYTVVTNGNSYVRLLLDDDKYVKLESGTKAIFSEVSGGKTAIDIERGALVAEVTKPLQVDEDFIVNTPNAVLAVRGTLFRVDLSRNDKGELNTDVMTYGGAVSSKRIQPSGEVEDIEVTIKEGFKATVNMDDKETVYLVDEVKVDLSALVGKPSGNNKPNNTTTETDINGDVIENTPITLESVLMPIAVNDIPDDDLVDIYFASENGHSMFIETKEIKTKIEERNIDIAEKTPVYEVAEKVKEPVEIVIPDDNKSLVTTTEPVTEAVVVIQGPPTDGLGETTTEVTTETTTELVTTTEPTTVTTTKAPTTTVPSTTAPTTTVPATESTTVTTTEQTTEPTTELTTEATTVHTHTEVTEEVKATCTKNGLKTVKCSDCGEIISETVLTATGHTEKTTTVDATCTVDGKTTVTCSTCGEIISETVLTATGHTEKTTTEAATCTVDGKTTVTCSTCGEIISETVLTATGHSEEKTTIEPTCTEAGKETVTCTVCDELISETILNATGHREIFSGAKDAHTECEICYEILSADHTYKTSTTNASCTLDGGTTYVCECGYNYTEIIPATGHTEETTTVDATCTVDGKITVSCSVCTETLSETVIPATGHTEENGAGADIHTKCSVCGNAVKDGSYHDYTDEVTTQNTCTSEGVLTHTCTCGWSYTEAIPASHKKSDDGLTCVNGCGGVWVDLNSTNFPDSMFLSYISTTYDADGNNALIGNEVTGVTTINVAGDSTADGGYTDLTGIKNFTNLVNVNCAYNGGITSLDLSGLTQLTTLDVTGLTGLEVLNISGCVNLTEDKITGLDTCTALTEFNASGCTNISELNLNNNNKLETVNLNGCTALTSFKMGDDTKQYFLNEIDLTGCDNLETLEINGTMYLTSFDFSDKTKIKSVDLGGCQGITSVTGLSGKTTLKALSLGGLNKMTELDVSGCTSLSELSISACTELVTINLTNTAITKFNAVETTVMDLSSYTKLQKAYLNGLTTTTSFVLTGATALKEFYLTNNVNIQSLDFSANTALEKLTLSSTSALTSLDISECASLNTLNLLDTGITSLTLTEDNASALTDVQITNNNSLADISISGASVLTSIKLSDGTENYRVKNLSITNSAIETLDVSFLKSIEVLDVSNCTSLTTLIATTCTELNTLTLTGCSGLTDIDVSGCTSLVSIDVDDCTQLENLNVSGSGITEFTATSLTSLEILDLTDCNSISTLTLTSCSNLTNVIGLSDCSALSSLVVINSGIQDVDLQENVNLETVRFRQCNSLTNLNLRRTDDNKNKFTSLTITLCGALKTLDLYNCAAIETLNIVELTVLEELNISNSGITTINTSDTNVDFSNNTSLNKLYMEKITQFTSIDISACTELTELNISGCSGITELDLTTNTALTTLTAIDCVNLSTLELGNDTKITDLNLSGCENLNFDFSGYNSLANVNVSNTAIDVIDFSSTLNLKSIVFTECASLTTVSIDATDGKLETVTFEGCENLIYVQIETSATLSTVSLAGATNLTDLILRNCTDITTLDVSTCEKINSIDITGSSLTATNITLPTGKDESIITGP